MRVAAIYDIHGNLPALEAVLEEVRQEGVDHGNWRKCGSPAFFVAHALSAFTANLRLRIWQSSVEAFDEADLRDSLPRQLEEMSDRLQDENVPHLHDPDLSLKRPPRNLHGFQRSARHLLPDQPMRQGRYSHAGAYQALDDLRSPNLHHGSGLHTLRLKPPTDQRTCVR